MELDWDLAVCVKKKYFPLNKIAQRSEYFGISSLSFWYDSYY